MLQWAQGAQPVQWMHAFVDVPVQEDGPARAFWSAATGWPVGQPWPGHPEFASLLSADGAPWSCVTRRGSCSA